jgi:Arc/MetJ-type ribon-helix-helix transcriptional regulator
MAAAKVAISIDQALLTEIDRRVSAGEFASRSYAIQKAVAQLLDGERRKQQLLRELSKLDIAEEQALADEGLVAEQWPKY